MPMVGSAAIRVAVTRAGMPMVVNAAHQLLQINLVSPTLWDIATADIREIAIGSGGTMFALGNTPVAAKAGTEYSVWRFTAGAWQKTTTTAVAIAACDETGQLLMMNAKGETGNMAFAFAAIR